MPNSETRPGTPGRAQRVLWALIPDIGEAVARFPVASLAAVLVTGFWLFDLDEALGTTGSEALRITVGLGAIFLWSMAASLMAEAWDRAPLYGQGLALAGSAAIALLFAFPAASGLMPAFAIGGLNILVGLAPYLRRGTHNDAFWQFNHALWLAALIALAGAVLFAGGLSVIIETLRYLFRIDIPRVAHEKLWTIALGLVAPVNWLSLAPRDFTRSIAEGTSSFTARAIVSIVKHIQVPFILAYTAILYAYGAKIALEGALPRGQLGHLVLGYGAAGMLTYLMAWPARESGGPLVRLFWRHWFWLTLGPIVLLAIAIARRIADYGLTEERYLVVLAGIWMAALAAIHLLRRAHDLRLVPGLLAALLLGAAIGPWGAARLSVASQTGELEALLKASGALRDGRIVSIAALKEKPDAAAKRRIRSILGFLATRHRLDAIAPWFEGVDGNPFLSAAARRGDPTALQGAVRAVFGPIAGGRLRIGRAGRSLWFSANRAGPIALDGADRLAGPFFLSPAGTRTQMPPSAPEADGAGEAAAGVGGLAIENENGRLRIAWPDGREAVFDLAATARRLEAERAARERAKRGAGDKRGQGQGRTANRRRASRRASLPPMVLLPARGDPTARLVLTALHARVFKDGSAVVRTARFWLLYRRASP